MKGKLIGISTFLTVVAFIVTASVTALSQEFFKAFNAKLSLFFFVGSIVMSGIYLLQNHSPNTKKASRSIISLLGLALLIFGAAVIFNVLPIRDFYNWLFVGGLIYTLLIELQLLAWGKNQHIFAKIMSFLVILTSLFLIAYFVAKWTYSGFQIWIIVAAFTNIGACLIGTFFVSKTRSETKQSVSNS